jgi:FMN phosphatase YigB (HAD superfamily)
VRHDDDVAATRDTAPPAGPVHPFDPEGKIVEAVRAWESAGPSRRMTRERPWAASPQVFSIDVFDSALVRACGAPEALYLWLGRRLQRRGLLACGAEVFARARQRVEEDVWAREGGPDAQVTLADFYGELVRRLGVNHGLVERLVAEELALEEAALAATRQADELLALADCHGTQIVFSSDTYLPSSFIRRQLESHGLWREGARCFSSTDHGASKANGTLFDVVARSVGVEASAILHLGDNHHCDVLAARRRGVLARWLPSGRLNRYEQLLSDARWATSGMSASLAGASRRARMQLSAGDARTRALRDVAAGVAAPMLVAYVLWLLQRARDLGLTRLYFVARDGQVLAEVASALVRRLDWELDIRYLHASRRTVNLAALHEIRPADLEWAFRGEGLTLAQLLQRLDLDAAELAEEPAAAELAEQALSTPVTPSMRHLLEASAESGPLKTLLLDKARARRQVVTAYLRQEGLLDGAACGIVDLGGVGSQMKALHELCICAGAPAPRLFLFGLDEHPDPRVAAASRNDRWLEDVECYLFDRRRGEGIVPPRGVVSSIQMFCAADHGTVLGYEIRGDRLLPVLETEQDRRMLTWGLPVVRETLRGFVDSVVLDDELVDLRADLRTTVCELSREFWRRPTAEEARAWGEFPFEGGEITAVRTKPVATRYTWTGVVRGVVDGSFPDGSWNHWFEASAAMSPAVLRRALIVAEVVYRRARALPRSRATKFGRRRPRVH